MTFGLCGIDWLHSLLDSHKQILIMPALSFFRCWKMLNCNNAKNSREMYDKWYRYINNYIGPKCHNEQKKFLHSKKEMELFFFKFNELLKIEGIDKVTVFWIIHNSYAYAKKINLNHKNIVVSHEHLPWPFENILCDFPKSNILMIVRDPRASIAGIIYGRKKDFGYLPDYTFNTIIENWLHAQDMWKKYYNVLGKRFKVVKNEDLHENLEKSMRELAYWLSVDYDDSLLYSSFSTGKPAPTDSKYLDNGKEPESLDNYYLPDNIKRRWMSVLNNGNEILYIENFLNEIFLFFRYERITNRTLFLRIKGFYHFLLPNRSLLKKWFDIYPENEEFDKVKERLSNPFLIKIWISIPNKIKLYTIIFRSILIRIIIFSFPGERWKRYDFPIMN